MSYNRTESKLATAITTLYGRLEGGREGECVKSYCATIHVKKTLQYSTCMEVNMKRSKQNTK